MKKCFKTFKHYVTRYSGIFSAKFIFVLSQNGLHVNEIKISFTYGERDVIIDLELNRYLITEGHFMRYQLPNGTRVVQHFTKTEIDLCHYKVIGFYVFKSRAQ